MFYFLRKVIVVCTLAVSSALGYWAETRWDVADHAADGWSAAKKQWVILMNWNEDRKKIVGTMEGRVENVLDANTLQVRSPDGLLYNFRLAGTTRPNALIGSRRVDGETVHEHGEELLERMAGNQNVEVDMISMTRGRAGTGIVYLNEEMVNRRMIESGWVHADIENQSVYPTGFWFEIQEALEIARTEQNGLWQLESAVESASER